jgi:hypothetical protein
LVIVSQFKRRFQLTLFIHHALHQGLNDLWGGVFGIPKVGDYVSEKENVDEDILKLGT